MDDENDSAALYVFNYTHDSGFVVISAEIWHEPICAYVDHGSVDEYDSVPGMLVEWFGKTVENIQLLRNSIYTDTANGNAAWYHLLQQTDLAAYNEQLKIQPPPPPPHGCDGNWTETSVGPLLPTTWGQLCSYNDLCPNLGCPWCLNNSAAPTGCVATAMSQLVRYWQPDHLYNYANMPLNQGNGDVQQLMVDAGGSVNMSYSCGGSGANGSDVPYALIHTFDFATATYGSYSNSNYSTVVSDLASNRPVFFDGCTSRRRVWLFFWKYSDCHEWVGDGYRQFSNECYSYLYFHMNWGWHEVGVPNDFNGWFLFNNWTIPGATINYQYAQHYTHNIHL